MIIEDRRKEKTIIFGDIEIGDVFEYDGELFMKVEKVTIGSRTCNSVCLNCGEFTYFSGNEEVSEPLNVKMVIENKEF